MNKELKVLSSRLESVSLNSLSERAVAFRDALSLVDGSSLNSDYEKSTDQGARNVDNMISASRPHGSQGFTTRLNIQVELNILVHQNIIFAGISSLG